MNPFDDDSADFHVLRNDEDQHSLWPTFREIPAGWTSVHGPVPRADAIAWVDDHWRDLRPLSARGTP